MWTVEGGRPTNLFSADGGKEGGRMGGRLLGGRECGAVAFAGFGSMVLVLEFKWAGLCRNYRG
jgi:hypothetical protein